jgi:hypothetical protein
MTNKGDWMPEELASGIADPELNQRTWDELSSKAKADTTRTEWKRYGPGGYERWRRFVWLDGDIEISPPAKQDHEEC